MAHSECLSLSFHFSQSTDNTCTALICFCAPGAIKLEVSSLGGFVVLKVDGSNGLVVGMETLKEDEVFLGDLRLALGGILINNDKMIVQVLLF